MLLQHRGEALASALLLAALCTSWLLFGWTENNVMTISCNIWFYFYLLSVFSVGRGEGGECISSHNISNGTIQCSLYNLRSGSQSLSAGVSSDSATAPRPRLWLRLCVSVSESLSFSWVVSVGPRHTQSPHSGSGLLYLQPVICQPGW